MVHWGWTIYMRKTMLYQPGGLQWARQDSNLEPIGYEPSALPLSYEPCIQ